MPIISGSGGGAGALTQLSSTTLGGAGTFDVSGISQAFNDLELRIVARGADAGAFDSLRMRFNNDSTAGHYHSQAVEGSNATAAAAPLTGATACWAARYIPAAGAAAGFFGMAVVNILGYSSATWDKTALSAVYFGLNDTDAGAISNVTQAMWLQTTAIDRIQIFGGTTANLAAGSRLIVYGVL